MKTVIFDVGNVLIHWDARAVYRGHFAGDAEIDAFLDEIGFSAWNLEQDRGRLFAEGVAALSTHHPAHAEMIARYDTHWDDAVTGPIEGTMAIMEGLLAQGLPVYGLTNFSAEKWPGTVARFPILGRFTDVVVSGEAGVVKPDPAIYRLLLDRNGLAAGDCVFVDDSPKNIDGARAVGLDAIHFTGAEALLPELRARGVPA